MKEDLQLCINFGCDNFGYIIIKQTERENLVKLIRDV